MRRSRTTQPGTFFRGTELARLMTMLVMLGVLVLLFDLARDERTWRWLAPQGGQPEAAASGRAPASDVVAAPSVTPGPADDDPLERDAAREELQAITDKVPLGREEMPAYWRLMTWESHQSTDALRRRARKDVTYNELWQRPDQWRGKLVEIRVHLRQAIRVDDLPDNPLGLKTIYEVCGWTSDSQPYWYWMVTPRVPPGMPLGKDIYEEATFVGYFLKLQPYEDREGKSRAMPLLIGRLIWHPTAAPPTGASEWNWTWYLAGALVALVLARMGLRLWMRPRPADRWTKDMASRDPREIEAWLDSAENAPRDPNAASDGHDIGPGAEATGPSAGER
jgi:hypothetical protein